jgi:acetolactate synthase I/II/III large subunit
MDALLTKTKAATEPEKREQSNQKISGSEIVLRSLVEEHVDKIFGYPGGAIMPIYDARSCQYMMPSIISPTD